MINEPITQSNLSNHSLTSMIGSLYPNEYSLLSAKQDLNSLKPSEKFIFYEDKLISNDFNLIYNLNIKNKVLYFADYTKLTYYVQELLKLQVEVI